MQLPLATIYDDQVWERLSLVQHTPVASVDDLTHRPIVVSPDDCFHMKLSVLALRRLTILKDHAGGHGIGALYI